MQCKSCLYKDSLVERSVSFVNVLSQTDRQIQRYRDTEIHRYTDTEIQRYTDTEIQAQIILQDRLQHFTGTVSRERFYTGTVWGRVLQDRLQHFNGTVSQKKFYTWMEQCGVEYCRSKIVFYFLSIMMSKYNVLSHLPVTERSEYNTIPDV